MKRLTKRLTNGVASWNYSNDCYGDDETKNKVFRSVHRQNACEKLAAIEDILGDEYDLDRLRELAQADKEGRVRIKGKAYKCPKCKAFCLTPRLDNQFYYCFNCKTQFTREKAEAALRREQDG